jgi:hypothetical protein
LSPCYDELQVKVIDNLETMEASSEFVTMNYQWTCTLSDGSIVYIRVDGEGNGVPLKFEDRENYCREVRKIRMMEFEEQVRNICSPLKILKIAFDIV